MTSLDDFLGRMFKRLKVTPEYVHYSDLRFEADGRDEVVREDGHCQLIVYREDGIRLHSGLFGGSEANMRATLAGAADALNEYLIDRQFPQRP
jgi:hypothetical protein